MALQAGIESSKVEFKFTQDYNLLNHLNWIMNNTPQEDCHVGLSKINIKDGKNGISDWLDGELKALNKSYVNRLIDTKSTSNIMMVISID